MEEDIERTIYTDSNKTIIYYTYRGMMHQREGPACIVNMHNMESIEDYEPFEYMYLYGEWHVRNAKEYKVLHGISITFNDTALHGLICSRHDRLTPEIIIKCT